MSGNDFSRRRLLKQFGATSAAVVGIGSSNVAGQKKTSDQNQKLAEGFDSASAVEKVLLNQAHDLLKELTDREIIARPAPVEFALDTKLKPIEASGENNGQAVTQYTNKTGIETAHIMVSKVTDEHNVTVHIQPQAEKTYAIVEHLSKEEKFVIDTSTDQVKWSSTNTTDDDVSTSVDCDNYSYCTNNICSVIDSHGSTDCYATRIQMRCFEEEGICKCVEDYEYCPSYYSTDSCYTSCS